MDELISIIIPAYNLEKYIERTILNVLSQNYPHFEIVVVNDGSKDGTASIIDRLGAKYPDKLRVIHIPNGGVTNARLTGVRVAKGNWIAFVDGDDLIEPNIYEVLLKNALDSHADISHCGYFMEFPSRVVPYHGSKKKFTHNKEDALVELLSGNLIEPSLWNKLYHKKLFDKLLDNSLMDLSIKINEDLLMNFYLFQEAQSSVFEDICLYRYMVRSGSAANSGMNEHHLSDPLRVRRLIMDESRALSKVYPTACKNYTRQLVVTATRPKKEFPTSLRSHRKQARRDLCHILRAHPPLQHSDRLMAWWAVISPVTYSIVHKVYGKIRGYNKLYEIK